MVPDLYGMSDPSGSGRVDMLTGPVAAARAVVATGAWVKSKHDMYLIRGKCGSLSFIFTHPPEDGMARFFAHIHTLVHVLLPGGIYWVYDTWYAALAQHLV